MRRPGRGAALAQGLAGLAFGLGLAVVTAKIAGRRAPAAPEAATLERVRARSAELEALIRQQRRTAEALKQLGGKVPPGAPTAGVVAPAPARPPVAPEVEAENRSRAIRARAVLTTALGQGRWNDDDKSRFHEQLAAMSDDEARMPLVYELFTAINKQQLRVEGQQLELF